MKEEDNKQEKTNDGTIHEHIIKNPTHINIDGSIAGINTSPSALNLSGRASAVDMVEASALGEDLLQMKINTIGDAKNFLVGVNNVASVFSENSELLKSIESASAIVLTNGRLAMEAIDKLNFQAIAKEVFATTHHLEGRQMVRLSESVTTILAYGQAVQNQFNTIIPKDEILRNGMMAFRDTTITLEKISDHIPVSFNSEAITSPFVYTPLRVRTKEVEKVLPEVKKELPVKTTEAIELMEYVFDPSTKNDDKRITTTVSELKRALKNMQGSVAMFIQQATHKVEITSMPMVQAVIEKSTSHTNKFPFKIPAGTTWQNIIIQFTDSNYVNIQVAGHSHPTGYADMGFVDKRTSKPTIQWALLSLLAKGGGFLPASSSDASDKYKKHKQLLSEKLKDYFNIGPDPFEPYKGGYKTRMTLVPPQEKQDEPKDDYSMADEIENIFRDFTE